MPVRLNVFGESFAIADAGQILLEHGSEDSVVIVRHVVVVRDQLAVVGVLAYRSAKRIADWQFDVRKRRNKSAVVNEE